MPASEINIQRLRWQCRRGLLELDLIFEAFLESGYERLTQEQKEAFQTLLLSSDPDLQRWMMGKEEPEEQQTAELIKLIREAT
ncbi:MAG: succinate dehydrogenase assembly factor 2 [Candidatus Polarisedimenticolaceae bacterium]|nr:succinate dehydrogenase assembly factor 2 [Candidatus Polarisedimenticolaceae bacterium]